MICFGSVSCACRLFPAYGPFLDFTGTKSALYTQLEGHGKDGMGALSSHMSFSPVSLFPKPRTLSTGALDDNLDSQQHAFVDQDSNLIVPASRTDSHLFVDESFSTPISYRGNFPSPDSNPSSPKQKTTGSISVQVISASHAPEHEIESQLETPLLGPAGERAAHKPPPFVPTLYFPPTKISQHNPPVLSHPDLQHTANANQQSQSRFPGGIVTISSVRPHGKSSKFIDIFSMT